MYTHNIYNIYKYNLLYLEDTDNKWNNMLYIQTFQQQKYMKNSILIMDYSLYVMVYHFIHYCFFHLE